MVSLDGVIHLFLMALLKDKPPMTPAACMYDSAEGSSPSIRGPIVPNKPASALFSNAVACVDVRPFARALYFTAAPNPPVAAPKDAPIAASFNVLVKSILPVVTSCPRED